MLLPSVITYRLVAVAPVASHECDVSRSRCSFVVSRTRCVAVDVRVETSIKKAFMARVDVSGTSPAVGSLGTITPYPGCMNIQCRNMSITGSHIRYSAHTSTSSAGTTQRMALGGTWANLRMLSSKPEGSWIDVNEEQS